LFLCLLALASCDDSAGAPAPAPPVAAHDVEPETPARVLELAAEHSIIARGEAVFGQYECNRCHLYPGIPKTKFELDCVGCHRHILGREVVEGSPLEASTDEWARWQTSVHSLVEVPILYGTNRFQRGWVVAFLQDTHDLRPNLDASMPRFSMPAEDAAALAALLVPAAEATDDVALGDAARGREIMEAKSCGTCHRFAGVPALPAPGLPMTIAPDALARGQQLAPDLRFARDRMRPAALVDWLVDPQSVDSLAAMPTYPLTREEARDVAAYLVQTPLEPVEREAVPQRLAVLERPVFYAEVHEKLFKKTCRHCHSNPEEVIGDGGPGFMGGFGFRKRALDLNSYEGIRSGSLDDAGRNRSVLAAMPDGTPRIVAHLMARHAEVAGAPVDGVRGMPLALPPLPLEDIQLLETWIVQGKKRGPE
jgi:mono/diheme cytochrome c family protein